MPILVNRVDDRLIHGQVIVGWGRPLGIDLIILVDDQVSQSTWEQDLYRMAVPPEIELRFASIAEAFSSPETSPPWPRFRRPTERWCKRSISAGYIIVPAAPSGCLTSISPMTSWAACGNSNQEAPR